MKTYAHETCLVEKLVCSCCSKTYSPFTINTFSPCCNKPLLVRYNVRTPLSKNSIDPKENSMWRYAELLPVFNKENIVLLGEGMTPLLALNKLTSKTPLQSILLKDEAHNPTGSFKARGLSMAVSKAKELGIDRLIIPTAGNAGGALAAYCAKAGIQCTVVMPEHTPSVFKTECRLFGAEVILVKGLINDCGKKVEEIKKRQDWFDVSTLKEPYRLEGKKTMGYEIAEQLNWQLPDVIVYPAGGGTGLIGIWKAFQEMLQLGWIKEPLPKMIAVQSANCASLVAAVKDPVSWKETFSPHPSIANGLAVPFPFGIDLMLEVIHQSKGEAVMVSENEIINGIKEVAETEGILLSPEGSAAWYGVKKLLQERKLSEADKVLFLNTGSGYKYLESLHKNI